MFEIEKINECIHCNTTEHYSQFLTEIHESNFK
jgi:hypothetical protein